MNPVNHLLIALAIAGVSFASPVRDAKTELKLDDTGWKLLSSDERVLVWRTATNETATLSVTEGQNGIPNLEDKEALRAFFRSEATAATAGIVEVETVGTPGATVAVVTTKFPMRDLPAYKGSQGHGYRIRAILPRGAATVTLQFEGLEIGAPGMRESKVAATVAQAKDVANASNATGRKDPYDSRFDAASLYESSDDPKWDKDFPAHPLTRIRTFMAVALTGLGAKTDTAPRWVTEHDARGRLAPEFVRRGMEQQRAGKFDLAIEEFTQALGIDPKSIAAFTGRADSRAAKREWEAAIADYDAALALAPSQSTTLRKRGIAKLGTRNFEGAVVDLNKAFQLNSKDSDALGYRGLAKWQKGDQKGALADFEETLKLNPRNGMVVAARAQMLKEAETKAPLDTGLIHLRLRDFDAAILSFSRMLEGDPKSAAAWFYRGTAKMGKSDFDAAMADFDQAILIDGNLLNAYNSRGTARRIKGDLIGAKADFDRAIELDPKFAAPYYGRGITKVAQRDVDGAIADFDRALQLEPNMIPAYVDRGVAKRLKNDAKGAEADLSRAVQLDPGNVAARLNRGALLRQLGNVNAAIADFDAVLKLEPDNVAAAGERAQALRMRPRK